MCPSGKWGKESGAGDCDFCLAGKYTRSWRAFSKKVKADKERLDQLDKSLKTKQMCATCPGEV
jgi:hypothetical protein